MAKGDALPVKRARERVAVLGLGYVGLTLAVTIAEAGYSVIGVETSEEVLKSLKKGKPHFYEKGLAALLSKHIGKRLRVSPEVHDASVYILCVGTPVDPQNNLVTSHLQSATKSVGSRLKPGNLVVLRSTVPMGTSGKLVLRLLEEVSGLKAGRDFDFVFAPERTVEGNALHEIKSLPQIIGGFDSTSSRRAAKFFRAFAKDTILLDSMESAEMLKMMDNTYRDVIFAYANQMALISEKVGLDFHAIVTAGNHKYPRNSVPYPSPGVGGPCLTKDPYILIQLCERLNVPSGIIVAGRQINEYMPKHLANKIVAHLRDSGQKDPKLFILGFAFKGNPPTSDLRGSNTIDLIRALSGSKIRLFGHDSTVAPEEIRKLGVSPADIEQGFEGADAVISMHNNAFYRDLDIKRLIRHARRPLLIVDCWRLWDSDTFRALPGVHYCGVGRS